MNEELLEKLTHPRKVYHPSGSGLKMTDFGKIKLQTYSLTKDNELSEDELKKRMKVYRRVTTSVTLEDTLINDPKHDVLMDNNLENFGVDDNDPIPLKDEWNPDFSVFKKMNIGFTAKYPGSGKSQASIEYAKTLGEKILVVTPWNKLREGFIDKGLYAITSFGFFGMSLNRRRPERWGKLWSDPMFQDTDKKTKKKKTKQSDPEPEQLPIPFDVIVFDELGLNDINMLYNIYCYMTKHDEQKFVANWDVYQCEPPEVNLLLNNVNTHEYYMKVLRKLFPQTCDLREIKRARCTDHINDGFHKECQGCRDEQAEFKRRVDMVAQCKTAKKVYEWVLSDDRIPKIHVMDTSIKRNITFTLPTRQAINNILINRDPKHYWCINDEIICIKTFPIHKLNEKTNNWEISDKNKILIHTQCSAIITGDGDVSFQMQYRDEKEFFVPKAKMKDYFDHKFAITGHSSQGQSFNERTCVFDMNHRCVGKGTQMVMLTRSRTPSQTVVYVGDNIRVKEDTSVIQNNIDGHMKTDEDKGLLKNRDMSKYVNEQWYEDKLLEQGGMCGHCHNPVDIPSIDRLDNGQAHWQYNCRIVCLNCNKSRKDTRFEYQSFCEE